MFASLKKYATVALLLTGSAILLWSCKEKNDSDDEALEAIKTEESENLTIVESENGRKSYRFTTPLLEGYTLGRDPYREFRKGIEITTYKDDSLTTVNATLRSNYAIYYENRKLWEVKGNVVVTKSDGTRLYTQQLFWNSITKRIYSNVDTKVVTDTDTFVGEGFESDEELNDLHFRRFKSKMCVDTAMAAEDGDSTAVDTKAERKTDVEKSTAEPAESARTKRTASAGRKPVGRAPQQASTPIASVQQPPASQGLQVRADGECVRKVETMKITSAALDGQNSIAE